MSFKKTYAFIRGSWDGTPGASNFTQSETVFGSTSEFADYVNPDIVSLVEEYIISGDIIQRAHALSADGKVRINTAEYVDEAAHDAYAADSRWSAEIGATKQYDVEKAPTPEDVGTFDEVNNIYYHSSAHLF